MCTSLSPLSRLILSFSDLLSSFLPLVYKPSREQTENLICSRDKDAYFEEKCGSLIDNLVRQVPLGGGIIGQAAYNNKHTWMSSEDHYNEQNFSGSIWDMFLDDYEFRRQFSGGMKTIAVIPVEPSSTTATTKTSALSTMLSAKLRKCCKSPSPSLNCLRLDTESSHIGVWQKRAGIHSDSNWVMTVELGKNKAINEKIEEVTAFEGDCSRRSSDEEDKIALQMIEELLNTN